MFNVLNSEQFISDEFSILRVPNKTIKNQDKSEGASKGSFWQH